MPHNLALIVAGKLSSGTSSLLRVVQEQIEPSIISHGQNLGPSPSGWKRPFVETASAVRTPIATTTKRIVEFPEKDECMCFHCLFTVSIDLRGKNLAMGNIYMCFLGPSPNEHLTIKVCLLIYNAFISSFVIGNQCAWNLPNVFVRCSP